MPLTDQTYTARLPLPDLIVRGQAHTIYCPVYLSGALVTVASGTVSVYNASNTAVVVAAVVTIGASGPQYTIAGATTTSLPLEMGWRVEWTLVIGSATMLARNTAALVRHPLSPSISDVDLYRRCPALDPAGANCITSDDDNQNFLDEAWLDIQWELIRRGNRPNLIVDPGSLRDVHLYGTLMLRFDDLATRLNAAFAERAQEYRALYQRAWSVLSLAYDSDDDGVEDNPQVRRAATPTVWI